MGKVVVINGIATVGKDKFIEFYEKHSPAKIINISTIDEVKSIAMKMGWDGTKDDKSRKFLSDLKDLWTEYNDGIFKSVVDYINKFHGVVIFVHCREPKEISKFKNKFKENCVTLLVKRECIHVPDNHADREVENYEYDMTLFNNGTLQDLEEKAIEAINDRWFY